MVAIRTRNDDKQDRLRDSISRTSSTVNSIIESISEGTDRLVENKQALNAVNIGFYSEELRDNDRRIGNVCIKLVEFFNTAYGEGSRDGERSGEAVLNLHRLYAKYAIETKQEIEVSTQQEQLLNAVEQHMGTWRTVTDYLENTDFLRLSMLVDPEELLVFVLVKRNE